MQRKNLLGWLLVLFGALSLVLAWPWGSLVGAILVVAGVLALKLQRPEPQPSSPSVPPPCPNSPSELGVVGEEAGVYRFISDERSRIEPSEIQDVQMSTGALWYIRQKLSWLPFPSGAPTTYVIATAVLTAARLWIGTVLSHHVDAGLDAPHDTIAPWHTAT
jgi:hypothetical protein